MIITIYSCILHMCIVRGVSNINEESSRFRVYRKREFLNPISLPLVTAFPMSGGFYGYVLVTKVPS